MASRGYGESELATTHPAPLQKEGLHQVLQFYVTKEDLASMETRLVKAIGEAKADILKTIILLMLAGIATTVTVTARILATAIQLFGQQNHTSRNAPSFQAGLEVPSR